MNTAPLQYSACAHGKLIARKNPASKLIEWQCPLDARDPNRCGAKYDFDRLRPVLLPVVGLRNQANHAQSANASLSVGMPSSAFTVVCPITPPPNDPLERKRHATSNTCGTKKQKGAEWEDAMLVDETPMPLPRQPQLLPLPYTPATPNPTHQAHRASSTIATSHVASHQNASYPAVASSLGLHAYAVQPATVQSTYFLNASLQNAASSTQQLSALGAPANTVNNATLPSSQAMIGTAVPPPNANTLASTSNAHEYSNPHDLRMQLERQRVLNSQTAFLLQQRMDELMQLGASYREMRVSQREITETLDAYKAEYNKLRAEHQALKARLPHP
ncbi:hypothetical protein CALCODRAFT_505446 [Calocera cornea HHB12733]|uniref:Uncharacterized protein n=1 Tax=Calocera cornea HHB12733 TaxID=1353952 RepID=A0A165K4Y9_9BASI|nr:hypothetical protein CALCODRAFT_505446 [Calocera cornea HHB12733]